VRGRWGAPSLRGWWGVPGRKRPRGASPATPTGWLKPEPMVLMVPSGSTSLTALLPKSATKTSPAASTATPNGWLKPEPMVVATVGVKAGSVEYWNRAVAVEPSGLAVPLSVAPVVVTAVAAPVATAGGGTKRNDRAGAATGP